MHINKEPNYLRIIEAVLLSVLKLIFMSFPLHFVMTAVNIDFTDNFMKAFLGSAIIGTVVAIPVAFLAMPVAQKLVAAIILKIDGGM